MFALPHLKPAWTEELLHHILEGDVATGGLQFDLRVLLSIVLLLILPFLIIIVPLYGVIPHHREVLQVPGHGSRSSRHPLPARPELSVTSPGMQNLPFQHHERDKSVMLRSENKACGREIATRCCRLLCITAHSTAWAPTTLPGLHALLNSEALPQQVASKRTKTSATGEKRQPLLRPILAAHPEPLSPAPPSPSHPKQQLWLPFLHITPSSSPNPWMCWTSDRTGEGLCLLLRSPFAALPLLDNLVRLPSPPTPLRTHSWCQCITTSHPHPFLARSPAWADARSCQAAGPPLTGSRAVIVAQDNTTQPQPLHPFDTKLQPPHSQHGAKTQRKTSARPTPSPSARVGKPWRGPADPQPPTAPAAPVPCASHRRCFPPLQRSSPPRPAPPGRGRPHCPGPAPPSPPSPEPRSLRADVFRFRSSFPPPSLDPMDVHERKLQEEDTPNGC